jgi:hypothetical protein
LTAAGEQKPKGNLFFLKIIFWNFQTCI